VPPPPVHINNVQLPQDDVKYLGLHLERTLTLYKHIFAKRKQLGITLTKMYWLLGRKSKLSTSNKLLIYKTILKPIWTYGIQLWGTASTSNTRTFPIENLAHDSGRTLVCAEYGYPKNKSTATALKYSARLSSHPKDLIVNRATRQQAIAKTPAK
jgi:hypothetical protein